MPWLFTVTFFHVKDLHVRLEKIDIFFGNVNKNAIIFASGSFLMYMRLNLHSQTGDSAKHLYGIEISNSISSMTMNLKLKCRPRFITTYQYTQKSCSFFNS